MSAYYGGIEAGGTKFVCAVCSGPDEWIAKTQFPTTTPDETFGRVIAFFQEQAQKVRIESIGIGGFGPLDLNPASPTFGYITSTPKPGWSNTDFIGAIRRGLRIPVLIDTDVNAAALGEHRWGAAQDTRSFIYLTIGTGIGGGALVDGRLVHGLIHPEMGHMFIPHDRNIDPFDGSCPFHGDCFEGLASGPAIRKRMGMPAETLPANDPVWALVAGYLAYALSNLICILSPQRIVLGGGVMQQAQLFPMTRQRVVEILNSYVSSPAITQEIDAFIVPPALGSRAGVLGAIALAMSG
ncbi:MAG: ROK family protein [Chloroflexota bacterium]|nr:MAG: ROK family protein [Chloroflexota bacterium]